MLSWFFENALVNEVPEEKSKLSKDYHPILCFILSKTLYVLLKKIKVLKINLKISNYFKN